MSNLFIGDRPGPKDFSAKVGPIGTNLETETARPERILRPSRPGQGTDKFLRHLYHSKNSDFFCWHPNVVIQNSRYYF